MDIHHYELPITCYQATELIRRCFDNFKRMNYRLLPTEKILKLGKCLVESSVIDNELYKEVVRSAKENRTHLLDGIRGLIGRENFRSCDILLHWMDKNGFKSDSKELEKRDRQYCLENMVRIEEKTLTQSESQERLEMYARSERFLAGTETANPNCMYQALYRSIDKPSLLPADYFGLKSALTYEYMTKHKPKQYLVELDDIEPGISKNWLGFVSYMQQKSHPGHPLVLFAAAFRFNFVVHVTSLAAMEEFALYPENRTARDGSELHHIYLAHVQKQHYISLIRIEDPRPFTYEELQHQLNQKTSLLSEIKQTLNKTKNEQKFKETQMMNKIKKLEDEKQILSHNLAEKEDDYQTMSKEKDERIRKLENKNHKLREELKQLKVEQDENKRENTTLMNDIKKERQNVLERQGEQIKELYRMISEQSRIVAQPLSRLAGDGPDIHIDYTGASSEQLGIMDKVHLGFNLDTERSRESRTFVKSSSLNRKIPIADQISRQTSQVSGIQSEPSASRRNSSEYKRSQSETKDKKDAYKENGALEISNLSSKLLKSSSNINGIEPTDFKTIPVSSNNYVSQDKSGDVQRMSRTSTLSDNLSRHSLIETIIDEAEETN